ncbi:hypothetical protein ACQP04_23175 [Pseudonocardia halophobica]|uniref:hypothetical protein n=1 Tax=Pseudonocardia halophobica TaxID=29401 RepID=UPI003D8DCB55
MQSPWLNLTNGNDLGGGKPVLTGPSFVDSGNIAKIAEYAAKNTSESGGRSAPGRPSHPRPAPA